MRLFPVFFSLILSSGAMFGAVDSALQSKIEALAAQHHGKLTLYASNLKTGVTVAVDAERAVPTASVIKLPILVDAMEQVKDGKHKHSENITLQKDDIVQGSGILQSFDTPHAITIKDALTVMIED